MKTPRPSGLFRLFAAPLLLSALLFAVAPSARAQFQVGNIVTTNFSLVNRYRWTNDNGQVFTPTNSAIRLSDFDGKIVFFVFYDTW